MFENKNILIWGLGLNDGATGMVKYFAENNAKVRIIDLRNEEQLSKSLNELKTYISKYKIELSLGEHKKEDFDWADIIVRNPAIKPDNEFLIYSIKMGKDILMEVSLFLNLAQGLKVGVTGTRGKSTTTSLIHEFLIEENINGTKELIKNRKIILGGNIGKSLINEIPNLNRYSISVMELSSFQLDGLKSVQLSPNYSVITNIFTDHVNWHGSMKEYVNAKYNILKYQTAIDTAVLNVSNKYIKKMIPYCKGQIVAFGKHRDVKSYKHKYYYLNDDNIHLYENDVLLIDLCKTNVQLKGDHNRWNILCAIACARKIGVSVPAIKTVLNRFSGLYGRQMFVKNIDGVDYYNDTSATTPEAMIAAVNRFYKEYNNKIIFISGGMDKQLEYNEVAKIMKNKIKSVILLEGTGSLKLKKVLDNEKIKNIGYYNDLKKAIIESKKNAEKGYAVVLCPGCASFNMFLNEWDRGEKYDLIVNNL